ncbi:Dystrophin, isoforms A/C/F/G/H [Anthophora retusa]
MQSIIHSIEQCNVIRYTSYRTAAKMQILHKELSMHYVQLELIAGVFERHRLSITENCVNLDPSEIEDVLSDIYFAACKENNANFDIVLSTKLALNYILTAFDKQCTRSVSVFSVKVALILISSGKLQEKYGYLYQQLADHNACLSKASLHTLLTNICKITEMLGENAVYGSQNIQSHIDKCFAKSQGCLGVTESEFATWVMQEPPLLVWITTFNRMKSAEHIVHNVRCSSCKTTPIQGPRYTCLKCTAYHQCQHCFLYGKISGKHKLKHPIREFCTKTSNREVTKLIIELIRNKLRLCPARSIGLNIDDQTPHIHSSEITHADCESIRSTMKRRVLSDPQKELQSIITHLEEENKQLQIELLDIQGTKAERLHRHRAMIESQLQRLKLLKKYLFAERICMPPVINHMQSTPMVPPFSSRLTALPINFELSPIIRQENTEQISDVNDTDLLQSNNFNPTGDCINGENHDGIINSGEASTSLGFSNVLEPTRIELSTWIGGTKRSDINPSDSGFSQWLGSNDSDCKEEKYSMKTTTTNTENESPLVISDSFIGIHRDNTPSSLQRPDKHSQHSSLQNIQGDLNDILDRLQNMVTDDRLLDDSYVANDNCKLKRATTEMEDLLTGLIQGMESRKSKLTTIV